MNRLPTSAYDRWKTTDPTEEAEELPEDFDEWIKEDQEELLGYLAMPPHRRKLYNSL